MSEEEKFSAQERAYRLAIFTHCGAEDEWKTACRVAIAQMRDHAAYGMRNCCDEAYSLLLEVSRLAAVAVYSVGDSKTITRKRFAILQALETARMIERAYNPRQSTNG